MLRTMKILILADLNSPHTYKWATSLTEHGLQIQIYGLNQCNNHNLYQDYGIETFTSAVDVKIATKDKSLGKWHYLKVLPQLIKIIKESQPDIVHAHYATSYGLLGALSGFKPFLLSVWGTDIFDFPKRSYVFKNILKFNLFRATQVLSTSHAMTKETQKYTSKPIEIIPFGIDLATFTSQQVTESLFNPEDIVIGTIKILDRTYGIEYLIRAFNSLKNKYPELPLKLLIVGDGPIKEELINLTKELDIVDRCTFTGRVDYRDIQKYHNMLSIFVAVSLAESFGVAVIEASACEKPVVVSNVGGLPEVVEDGETGFIVPPKNVESTAKALEKLILDKELRGKMGRSGRDRVKKLFNWPDNVQQMADIYNKIHMGNSKAKEL